MANLKKHTVALLLAALVAFFSIRADGFATWNNFFNLLRQTSILGIVSAGMMIVIITGSIDLSVGSVLSFVSCLVAILIGQQSFNPVIACVLGVFVAICAMVVNCCIIEMTKMPAMLCTLAMMQIFQGLTYIITKATPVYGLPGSLRMLGQGYLGPIPVPVIIMAVCFLVSGYIMSRTYPGRYFYAVGSNREAARLTGIPVTLVSIGAFALCGLFVGIASCVQMSRLFGGYPSAGSGLEMDVITAVVVGGVSFSGGKGKMTGVIQGVLLMGVLSNGLGVMGTSTYTQLVFKGIVLVIVVGLDCLQKNLNHRNKGRAPA